MYTMKANICSNDQMVIYENIEIDQDLWYFLQISRYIDSNDIQIISSDRKDLQTFYPSASSFKNCIFEDGVAQPISPHRLKDYALTYHRIDLDQDHGQFKDDFSLIDVLPFHNLSLKAADTKNIRGYYTWEYDLYLPVVCNSSSDLIGRGDNVSCAKSIYRLHRMQESCITAKLTQSPTTQDTVLTDLNSTDQIHSSVTIGFWVKINYRYLNTYNWTENTYVRLGNGSEGSISIGGYTYVKYYGQRITGISYDSAQNSYYQYYDTMYFGTDDYNICFNYSCYIMVHYQSNSSEVGSSFHRGGTLKGNIYPKFNHHLTINDNMCIGCLRTPSGFYRYADGWEGMIMHVRVFFNLTYEQAFQNMIDAMRYTTNHEYAQDKRDINVQLWQQFRYAPIIFRYIRYSQQLLWIRFVKIRRNKQNSDSMRQLLPETCPLNVKFNKDLVEYTIKFQMKVMISLGYIDNPFFTLFNVLTFGGTNINQIYIWNPKLQMFIHRDRINIKSNQWQFFAITYSQSMDKGFVYSKNNVILSLNNTYLSPITAGTYTINVTNCFLVGLQIWSNYQNKNLIYSSLIKNIDAHLYYKNLAFYYQSSITFSYMDYIRIPYTDYTKRQEIMSYYSYGIEYSVVISNYTLAPNLQAGYPYQCNDGGYYSKTGGGCSYNQNLLIDSKEGYHSLDLRTYDKFTKAQSFQVDFWIGFGPLNAGSIINFYGSQLNLTLREPALDQGYSFDNLMTANFTRAILNNKYAENRWYFIQVGFQNISATQFNLSIQINVDKSFIYFNTIDQVFGQVSQNFTTICPDDCNQFTLKHFVLWNSIVKLDSYKDAFEQINILTKSQGILAYYPLQDNSGFYLTEYVYHYSLPLWQYDHYEEKQLVRWFYSEFIGSGYQEEHIQCGINEQYDEQQADCIIKNDGNENIEIYPDKYDYITLNLTNYQFSPEWSFEFELLFSSTDDILMNSGQEISIMTTDPNCTNSGTKINYLKIFKDFKNITSTQTNKTKVTKQAVKDILQIQFQQDSGKKTNLSQDINQDDWNHIVISNSIINTDLRMTSDFSGLNYSSYNASLFSSLQKLASCNLLIGYDPNSQEQTTDKSFIIKEFRIWNKAVNVDESRRNYLMALPKRVPDLAAYFKFIGLNSFYEQIQDVANPNTNFKSYTKFYSASNRNNCPFGTQFAVLNYANQCLQYPGLMINISESQYIQIPVKKAFTTIFQDNSYDFTFQFTLMALYEPLLFNIFEKLLELENVFSLESETINTFKILLYRAPDQIEQLYFDHYNQSITYIVSYNPAQSKMIFYKKNTTDPKPVPFKEFSLDQDFKLDPPEYFSVGKGNYNDQRIYFSGFHITGEVYNDLQLTQEGMQKNLHSYKYRHNMLGNYIFYVSLDRNYDFNVMYDTLKGEMMPITNNRQGTAQHPWVSYIVTQNYCPFEMDWDEYLETCLNKGVLKLQNQSGSVILLGTNFQWQFSVGFWINFQLLQPNVKMDFFQLANVLEFQITVPKLMKVKTSKAGQLIVETEISAQKFLITENNWYGFAAVHNSTGYWKIYQQKSLIAEITDSADSYYGKISKLRFGDISFTNNIIRIKQIFGVARELLPGQIQEFLNKRNHITLDDNIKSGQIIWDQSWERQIGNEEIWTEDFKTYQYMDKGLYFSTQKSYLPLKTISQDQFKNQYSFEFCIYQTNKYNRRQNILSLGGVFQVFLGISNEINFEYNTTNIPKGINQDTNSFIGHIRNIKLFSVYRSVGSARASVRSYSTSIMNMKYLIADYPLTESIGDFLREQVSGEKLNFSQYNVQWIALKQMPKICNGDSKYSYRQGQEYCYGVYYQKDGVNNSQPLYDDEGSQATIPINFAFDPLGLEEFQDWNFTSNSAKNRYQSNGQQIVVLQHPLLKVYYKLHESTGAYIYNYATYIYPASPQIYHDLNGSNFVWVNDNSILTNKTNFLANIQCQEDLVTSVDDHCETFEKCHETCLISTECFGPLRLNAWHAKMGFALVQQLMLQFVRNAKIPHISLQNHKQTQSQMPALKNALKKTNFTINCLSCEQDHELINGKCTKIVCPDGQYYNSTTLQCQNCKDRCRKCLASNSSLCTECLSSFQKCTQILDMTNPYKNGKCTEICGNGIRVGGLLNCDDGNNLNNDGCSSICSIEYGYECLGGNQTHPDICTYSLRPYAQIQSVINGKFIATFNDSVVYANNMLTKQDLKFEITDTNDKQILKSWTVINQNKQENQQILIFFKTTIKLQGNEIIYLKFLEEGQHIYSKKNPNYFDFFAKCSILISGHKIYNVIRTYDVLMDQAYYPEMVKNTLTQLDFTTMSFLDFDSEKLPFNAGSWIDTSQIVDNPPDQVFIDFGITKIILLIKYKSRLYLMIACSLFIPIIALINKLYKKKNRLKKVLYIVDCHFRYNLILGFFTELNLEMSILAFLQIKNALLFSAPIGSMHIIQTNFNKLKDKVFFDRNHILLEGWGIAFERIDKYGTYDNNNNKLISINQRSISKIETFEFTTLRFDSEAPWLQASKNQKLRKKYDTNPSIQLPPPVKRSQDSQNHMFLENSNSFIKSSTLEIQDLKSNPYLDIYQMENLKRFRLDSSQSQSSFGNLTMEQPSSVDPLKYKLKSPFQYFDDPTSLNEEFEDVIVFRGNLKSDNDASKTNFKQSFSWRFRGLI
ncbi:UNKNOWN [Stylonychia lemnae]|uniref:Uncharacterized protein n=1 Tax=Stylonychia lemnae TaxID=5949 RepID=A0A078AWG9_STYLE|nr:UNKNOWN [Stylonychia lemnae]|eukprot:CDW85153.1 UNKNOWN [Stylonychia lemnae]